MRHVGVALLVAVPGQCEDGKQPCGLPGQALCPRTHYCLSGCCVWVNID